MLRADLDAIYAGEPVTVINRLDAKDGGTKADQWLVTVVPDCRWGERQVRTVQADGTVAIATVHTVKIPETDAYATYRDWKASPSAGFTLRGGDYLIRGEVSEAIDASNVREVVKAHEPDAFQVQAFRKTAKKGGLGGSKAGVLRFAEGYHVEG